MYHGSQLSKGERAKFVSPRQARLARVSIVTSSIVLCAISIRSIFSASLPRLAWAAAFVVVMTALMFWVVLPPLRRMMWVSEWKEKYKAIGRCPACQYQLADFGPEEDGCTVCPECGGAWRLPG